jgi:competence protein ComGC
MVITIVILSILLVASIYVNVNLTRKFEKLEEMAENSVDTLLENEKFLTSLKNRLLSQQSYLRQLDRIGAFEADDETGYFFKELKSIVNDISLYLGEKPINEDTQNSVLANLKSQDNPKSNKYDVNFESEKDYYL